MAFQRYHVADMSITDNRKRTALQWASYNIYHTYLKVTTIVLPALPKFKVSKSTLLGKLDVDSDGDVDLDDIFALFKDQDGDGDFDLQDLLIRMDSNGDGHISVAEGAMAFAGISAPVILIFVAVQLVLIVLGVCFVKKMKQINLTKLQEKLKAEKYDWTAPPLSVVAIPTIYIDICTCTCVCHILMTLQGK